MEGIKRFIKRETVLCVAAFLAFSSAFLIPPDKDYIGYIDYRVIGILLSLMMVMEGFKKIGAFQRIGDALLKHTANVRMLSFILIMLCFFSSMFITNDVALLTFVPFAMLILKQAQKEALLIPVLCLQTIAANLGSMLTPIGNPQNLYLYQVSGMNLWEFMRIMLPYCVVSFVLLIICIMAFPNQNIQVSYIVEQRRKNLEKDCKIGEEKHVKRGTIVLLALFFLCLLVVVRILPYYIVFAVVVVALLIYDYEILKTVDYCLILTFIFFFLFIGNMGRITEIRELLQSLIQGNERCMGILTSQVVSNVPATLLLSGFTKEYKQLLVGVNLGGLGTLIASMASLISYKLYAHEYNDKKGRYLLWFTILNLGFLAVLTLPCF